MKWLVLSTAAVASALQNLPPVAFQPADPVSGRGFSPATADHTIYLDATFAHQRDQDGPTLIPAAAYEFANTFRQDLETLTNSSWDLQTVGHFPLRGTGVFIERSRDSFTYEDGRPTEEGYELEVEDDRLYIRGSGARGMWWGTRTVLQQLVLTNQSMIPSGRMHDAPAFATRGFMLDAGRKWYSLSFLKDLCTYASFFKISEFHYHATDNYPLTRGPDLPWNEVYSQFALRPENPDLQPLVQRANETLSRDEFDQFQVHCAQRGVTVIPEIEGPGHCLSVTKWKPELALAERDLLNLSHPETIPLMRSIWSEFLPWFHTSEVHIGADEYNSTLADDYIGFVNEMSHFIEESSGKQIRIWGTYEPSSTLSIDKNVTIQHWQYGQSDPVALARDGYQIINSEDWWAYMSLKNNHVPITPAPYPQSFNNTRILNFANQDSWQWAPQLFNPVNTTEQPHSNAVRGAILAAWNDNGPDATTQLEAYYAIRNGIPVVASRSWTGSRGPRLDETSLDESIALLTSNAVGQNLDRRLPRDLERPSGSLLSWNRPQRDSEDRELWLGDGSKGMNYTLRLNVTGPFSLCSSDSELTLTHHNQLIFTSDGWPYPLRSVSETDGFDPAEPGRIWANATSSTHRVVDIPFPAQIMITSDPIGGSRAWINGSFVGRFEVFVYGGDNVDFSWSQMAFVAPLDTVQGPGLQQLAVYPFDGQH
ncbi:uncharacterized protein PFLUO_LOCUS7081 [Penicillium psychrofluorescens]|uniref:uncharacterized protein n=1 Tax=Penicillium psychrofluorescens TaxID=3158075 RepID=UPI003CCCA24E